jgi:SAM-dependent methyltransferase
MEISILTNYLDIYRRYEANGFSRVLNPQDSEFSGDLDNYFSIGRQGLEMCINALITLNIPAPKSILDFPAGSGRVLRHLAACFPEAKIHACDLYEHHLEFCKNEFGAEISVAHANPEENKFPCTFDLIFIGSLLSHLPLPGMQAILRLVAKSLNDGGIAVMTTEGRFTVHAQQNRWKLVSDELFGCAYESFKKDGFGFVDYTNHRSQFHKQENYGFALAHPSFVTKQICETEGLRLVSCTEFAWNSHQDCYVVQKTNIPLEIKL